MADEDLSDEQLQQLLKDASLRLKEAKASQHSLSLDGAQSPLQNRYVLTNSSPQTGC
jgi:hypothetical protein